MGTSIVQEATTSTVEGDTIGAVNKTYNTSSTLRVYRGHKLTFTSSKTITKIEFTFSDADRQGSLVSNVGTYTDGVWTLGGDF